MIDLRDFITETMNNATASDKNNINSIVAFFVDNDWFGSKPTFENGTVSDDKDIRERLRLN